jgi:beta propeller repeat protein
VGSPPRLCRCARALAIALLVSGSALAQAPDPAPPVEVIVRLQSAGPHAITDCAAAQYRRARPLAAIARDGSDSLDRLNAELGARAVRAVFRRSDGRPLAESRAALAARARGRRDALPEETRAALPPVPGLADVYRVALPPGADAASAAARYAADPHVVWAHPSRSVAPDLDANDPYLASSGSFGQPYADLWGILRVRAPEAWDLSQGDGVLVAVNDTGIDPGHPDLAANLWVNPGEDLDGNGVVDPADRNGIDDDANGFVDDLNGFDFANSVDANGDGDFNDPGDVSDPDPFDDYGHGTHVGGTIAAVANNGIGVAGVAPRALLMAVKGFRASGSTPDSVLARGMVYAADNGARVINNSWSCSPRCPSNPVLEEAQAYAASLGAVVVTSAGNRSDDVAFYSPKPRRDNIVVGATDNLDRPALFTNFGVLVSVVAPGSGDPFVSGVPFAERAILSALSSGAGLEAHGGGVFTVGGEYVRWAGTSMSAPHVAGIAALVLALHPEYTPDDVRAVIRSSARDLGAAGHDRVTGAGLADAVRALQAPLPAVRAFLSGPPPSAAVVPAAETVVIQGAVTGPVTSALLSVGVGRNPARFDPIPLASPLPDSVGELARWDVSAREDGPYLLQLDARGADGSHVVEFLPIALERNVPRRISSPGAAALAPAISGRRVVWQSQRPQRGEDLGVELFAREWSTGEEWHVAGGPGDQHSARISGDRLAWHETDGDTNRIASCRLRELRAPCRERIAIEGPGPRSGLELSGDTLVWSEGNQLAAQLRACRFRGGSCEPLATPASPGRQLLPVLRGRRLWWRDHTSGWLTLMCAGFPERCAPVPLEATRWAEVHAGSRERLVWVDAFATPNLLYVCRATAAGTCPARQIASFPFSFGTDVAVDQHRVVWATDGPGGDLDVYFCEDDDRTGACPVQRLTASAADQRNPEVSGTRVVWEDDRDGETMIAGFELPSLDPVPDRGTAAGRRLRIEVRGRDPAGGALALSAAFADGVPLAERGAVFSDRGDGTGVLRWTPGASDVGSHIVTFAGRTAARLTTRTSARITVQGG